MGFLIKRPRHIPEGGVWIAVFVGAAHPKRPDQVVWDSAEDALKNLYSLVVAPPCKKCLP